LGLTLIGETSEHPGERTELAFSAAAPADFPEALEGAVIERVGAHQYRIASAPREWLIEATAVHVHRDIAVPFYRAIPPRRVPLAKRIFWRVVLARSASTPTLSSTNSGKAPARAATTGRPHAMASRITRPKVSLVPACTSASADAIHCASSRLSRR